MSTQQSLPPLAKINLIAVWIETVLYGINVLLFLSCVTILLSGRKQVHKLLLFSSILLFSLSTAQVALSLRQLIEAFVLEPAVSTPQGGNLYFLQQTNGLSIAKNLIYALNVQGQDWLVIWRFHIVIGGWWTLIPSAVECVHMAVIYVGIAEIAKSNGSVFADVVRSWIIAGLTIALALNVAVTGAIAIKLWWASRITRDATNGDGAYKSAIFTITESGAIYTTASVALTIVYITGNPVSQSATNIVTQLATLAPLLIVVRVGLGLTHRSRPAWKAHVKRTHSSTASSSGVPTPAPVSFPAFQRQVTLGGSDIELREEYKIDEAGSES